MRIRSSLWPTKRRGRTLPQLRGAQMTSIWLRSFEGDKLIPVRASYECMSTLVLPHNGNNGLNFCWRPRGRKLNFMNAHLSTDSSCPWLQSVHGVEKDVLNALRGR